MQEACKNSVNYVRCGVARSYLGPAGSTVNESRIGRPIVYRAAKPRPPLRRRPRQRGRNAADIGKVLLSHGSSIEPGVQAMSG